MTNPVETYLQVLRDTHYSGAAVKETAHYPALANLLNEVGKTLKPKVRCIIGVMNQGAGLPDGGFFTPEQLRKGAEPGQVFSQLPTRGAMEVKSPTDEVDAIIKTTQVQDYLKKYGLVLVTNYRDFQLLQRDGLSTKLLERYTLAATEQEFWNLAAHPRAAAEKHGERLTQYLARVMQQNAPLMEPKDLAWFLASYARDAKARVENADDLDALDAVRAALEEALGLKFEGEKGAHFFRSTLVQTLFYGLFSAWVLWSKGKGLDPNAQFDWKAASWSLHVPMIRALYEQVSTPTKLGPLGLEQVMDWAGEALNRVAREEFFRRFQEEHAVQYFYEPFLEAFDPELRKELGVWYTPPEIVKYMVERVDTVLREELNIADGLANPNVYVLDPCCGTGAYLVDVLKRIEQTLRAKGDDALIGKDIKEAAMKRVFGFEILPAPFVVAHLQLGLMLQNLGAPLSDDQNERAGVYLTNALTGWEPPKEPKSQLALWAELRQEREAANKIKREAPILVILGNPPYNGYAGIAMDEERGLSDAYRATERVAAPQGQGLNDLYVRFYRMAERRITEDTGRGVVCFISNYSWLDGLSFTGMRERYLQVFDKVWVDCLNGDKYKTGKLTPGGDPDPSVFSTEWNREGIQVGTAIGLLVRKQDSQGADSVQFRHFWGKAKREELLQSASGTDEDGYQETSPAIELGLPFTPMASQAAYLAWPLLPDLFPVSYPGVQTSRDEFVVDMDQERLLARMQVYFDLAIPHEEMRRISPTAMANTARFKAAETRDTLRKRGFLAGNIVRFCYRPFDVRWLYWEPETKLLDEKRSDYYAQVFIGNCSIGAAQTLRHAYDPPIASASLCSRHVVERGANLFPLFLRQTQSNLFENNGGCKPNLSDAALGYILTAGAPESAEHLFHHILATLHAHDYAVENSGALLLDWPRIPLPNSRDLLEASAELGKQIAALLDTETEVPGVTSGTIRPELAKIGAVTVVAGENPNFDTDGLAVTAGWGHAGKEGVTMPGKGKLQERKHTPDETSAMASCENCLGASTLDVFLNDKVYWKNIPRRVWDYHIGGYQVIKKWLSYRELQLLGRPLRKEEAREVMNIARRIAAILLLEPKLDANYEAVNAHCYDWKTAQL